MSFSRNQNYIAGLCHTGCRTYSLTTVGNSKGMKVIDLTNGLDTSRTYHCPICGNKDIVRCGRCHRITCYDKSGHFKCAHCGNSGKVSGTMKRIEVYDSSGMKSGLKQDGMKYYPGNK